MIIQKQLTVNSVNIAEYKFPSESAMEGFIYDNESILRLDDNNFSEVEILGSQIQIDCNQKNIDCKCRNIDTKKYQRIDLLVKYSKEYLAIVELKKDKIDQTAVDQLKCYLNNKEDFLKQCYYINFSGDNYNEDDYNAWKEELPNDWIGILAAPTFDDIIRTKLSKGQLKTSNNQINLAGLSINRFRGNDNQVYVVSEPYFKPDSGKDYTKYKFQGEVYNKGRLVNEVLRAFVNKNTKLTFDDLGKDQCFPKDIQGSHGVFEKFDEAVKTNNKGYKRYYTKPEEIITLDDGAKIATSNQWGYNESDGGNIKKFTERANEIFNKLYETNNVEYIKKVDEN